MPTLTKLAGWNRSADVKFDGLDVWPILSGAVEKPEPRTIYIPHPGGSIVLRGGMKLIVHKQRGRRRQGEEVELFDVTNDPSETKDLAKVAAGEGRADAGDPRGVTEG
jgi:hypothetical protein